MKRNKLILISALTALICGNTSVQAEEVTASYANPVEYCVNGDMNDISSWTVASTWKHNTTGVYPNFSKPFMELWVKNVGPLANNSAYQVAKDLPTGLYILKGAINAVRQLNSPPVTTGVKFYMNSDSIACSTGNGVPEIFTIKKVMNADTIKFGIDIKNTNANWIAWDNVSLTYYGDSVTYEKDKLNAELQSSRDELTAAISKAKAIADDETYTYAKDDLKAATAVAEGELSSAMTKEKLNDATSTLNTSINDYSLKAANYKHPYDVCVNGTMAGSNDNFSGWTIDINKNTPWKANSSVINNFDGTFMEAWNGSVLPDKYVYQVAKNMPAGVYILEAAINAVKQGTLPTVTGVKLYMNDKSVDCSTGNGAPEIFTIKNVIKTDSIKFGVDIKSTNANWFAWDNVSLSYCGDSATYEKDHTQALADAYNLLCDSAATIIRDNKVPGMSEILQDMLNEQLPTENLDEYYTQAIAEMKEALTTADAVISGNLNTLIINADGSNGTTGWNTNMGNAKNERFDGASTTYFDKWNGSAMDIYANQTVNYLPAGHYTLTVATRGALGVTAKVFANNDSVDILATGNTGGSIWVAATNSVNDGAASNLAKTEAAINGSKGYGWYYNTINVTLTEPAQSLTLGFEGSINNSWASFTDWTLANVDYNINDTVDITKYTTYDTSTLDGWTNNGFAIGGWAPEGGYVNGDASCQLPFIEKWVGGPATLPDATIEQKLTDLPEGEYEISASFIATQQNDANITVGGVWLFANDDSVNVATGNGVPQLFTLNVASTDGTLNYGVKTRSTSANWVAFDNVTIKYIGNGETLINQEIDNVTSEEYEGVTNAQVVAAVSSTLNKYDTYQTLFDALVAMKEQLSNIGVQAAELDTLIKLAESYDENSTVEEASIKTTFESAIDAAQNADILNLPTAINALEEAVKTYTTSGANPTNGIYFDMSEFIVNGDLDTENTGWSEKPSIGSNCAEMYNKTFDMYQTVANMPAGNYELGVSAFHRPGFYSEGIESTAIDKTKLYANEDSTALLSLYYSTEGQIFTNGTGNYADNMGQASEVFEKDLYLNSLAFSNKERGGIKIGIKNDDTVNGNWTIFREFTLKFWGTQTVIPTDVDKTEIAKPETGKFDIFNTLGQRIRTQVTTTEGLEKGIYIIKGKTLLVP